MSENVLVEHRDDVATIIINRPEASNSLDIDLARRLLTAISGVAADQRARCVVLKSAGDRFCVGGDIGGFANAGSKADKHIAELAGTMHEAILGLARMDKPVISLVQGPAAGAGLGLALAADIVLASRNAHFTAAYSAIGLTPDCGLTWILPRLVGHRRAAEMILTNRRLGAEEALAVGLISRISDQLEEEGMALALSLAAGATRALGSCRALLHDSLETGLERQLERELSAIQAASIADEGQEGIAAFIGRRPPNFRRG